VVRSAVSLAPVVAIVCCVFRRNKFRFGHAVQAIQGGWLDVDEQADNSPETPASRPLPLAEFSGHLSSMHMSSVLPTLYGDTEITAGAERTGVRGDHSVRPPCGVAGRRVRRG
jgi:hypothetical protein